ncbi:2-dehydro-3-deoxygluconokinase [Nocardioides luteus]|uniref:Carbohydrate kinase n=1 Tax=Nocardioides luteus TaxID=1844 RepID=A0ABQ5SYN2_9ACTN|nr:sugar kinase [Nocardioides luteus]MDR7310925.1 2-dehydro-3-deoxygluconokinase [Nocardioides luteus]GGR39715.1 carbohydrate kinase [Nocardioides luteus]GLJ69295.1 carbohydrate kinase [Nocardioides luteus]
MGSSGDVRAVCLGEAMVVLRPDGDQPLAAATTLLRSVGGAEANVAGGLAALGVPTAWVSRLGQDPFGDVVVDDLTGRGVQVEVDRDPARPTGLYVKEPAPGGSRMHYYRAGSAAAAMDADLLARPGVVAALASAEVVHTSGITLGILEEDSGLVARLLALREKHGFRLSVDLNWRPALWTGASTAPLLALLRAADVVLLGADEARAALGAQTPEDLRELLGPRPRLVIKSDSHAAGEYDVDGRATQVPALRVDVVEPVGAGDGFAAGYLAGLVDGSGPVARLRQGHLVAATVLAAPGDHAAPPPADVRSRLLASSEEEWAATRVSADGIVSPALTNDAPTTDEETR